MLVRGLSVAGIGLRFSMAARSVWHRFQRLVSTRAKVLRIVAVAIAAFLLIPYAVTPFFMLIDPPTSAFILRDKLSGRSTKHIWRDLEQISPNLATQVIVSEDSRFCEHWGVDWEAIDDAIDASENGRPRGASTIPMQTAKNLFLWNRPAYLRKIFEIPLAYYMDFVLGKRRMIEIYLNIAEWAPGVFGAEAAARHHFGKSASQLTMQEAAQLAAALPNPKRRSAGRPAAGTFALANRLRLRAARERSSAACVRLDRAWKTQTEPLF